MNKTQRKKLEKLIDQIAEIQEQVESIKDQEQGKLDNMPENLHYGERYSQIESIVSSLEEAASSLDIAKDDIQSSIEQ